MATPRVPAALRKKVGRPTLYRPEFAEQARKFCLLSRATDVMLAAWFEIDVQTIYDWRRNHPEFSQAIKEGKDLADAEMAASLFQRGAGFERQVPQQTVTKTGDVVDYIETKYYPPDVAAAFIWLKNRQPKVWRDRTEVAVEDARDDDTETIRAEITAMLEGVRSRLLVERTTVTERAVIDGGVASPAPLIEHKVT